MGGPGHSAQRWLPGPLTERPELGQERFEFAVPDGFFGHDLAVPMTLLPSCVPPPFMLNERSARAVQVGPGILRKRSWRSRENFEQRQANTTTQNHSGVFRLNCSSGHPMCGVWSLSALVHPATPNPHRRNMRHRRRASGRSHLTHRHRQRARGSSDYPSDNALRRCQPEPAQPDTDYPPDVPVPDPARRGQTESPGMACKRSGVRIPIAPPF